MRNFIKYPSLKLRPRREYSIPAGPIFRFAWKRRINLLGSWLEFHAPGHAPAPNRANVKRGPFSYPYADHFSDRTCGHMPSESWEESPLFSRTWDFYGSWFIGRMGRVQCRGAVLHPKYLGKSINFLHPKAFESAVLGYITAESGHIADEDNGTPYQLGPLNWHPIKGMSVPAVVFDLRQTVYHSGGNYRLLFFPISAERVVVFSFSYTQYCTGPLEEMDSKISPKPLLELIDNIINSMYLTPSAELQQAIDQVKQQCPDLSVSPECQPLKWPAHVDKDGITILDYDKHRYPEYA